MVPNAPSNTHLIPCLTFPIFDQQTQFHCYPVSPLPGAWNLPTSLLDLRCAAGALETHQACRLAGWLLCNLLSAAKYLQGLEESRYHSNTQTALAAALRKDKKSPGDSEMPTFRISCFISICCGKGRIDHKMTRSSGFPADTGHIHYFWSFPVVSLTSV